MEIRPPDWHLRNVRCGVCEQGRLCFSACPRCGHVLLVCDEEGSVFEHPLVAPPIGWFGDDAFSCPRCRAVPVHAFPSATSDQVQALGYAVTDYE